MLFAYKFLHDHSIYILQKWIDELFLEVWCKADNQVEYDIELLPNDLKELVIEIQNSNRIKEDYLYGPIKKVYIIFQQLNAFTKDKLAEVYKQNNRIEDLCKQTNNCEPFLYSALNNINENLGIELEEFFKNLFNKVIHLEPVQNVIGKLDSHYDEFISLNDKGKCPFCGINDIKGKYVSKREAYDHFLPKDLYPFNSVNFNNLAPMCHECNSSYKLKSDPLHKKDKITRRKAFFAFDNIHHTIQIKINLLSKDITNLVPEAIQLELTSVDHGEEIDSWKEVFGIEERYKAKCLEKEYGKYWFEQAEEEYKNAVIELGNGFTKQQWIQYQINVANRHPYANGNFIKAEFLKACQRVGVL